MVEELKEVDNIYDLMALCGAYILQADKEKAYDFSEFQDERYDDVYDAMEAYCCAKKDKGSGRAFADLKKYIIRFLGVFQIELTNICFQTIPKPV